MPDAVKDDPTEETINMYDELLSNVKTPLTLSLIHISLYTKDLAKKKEQ